eukprot:Nitzschia sp. Nitz4//scaffold50_size126154//66587//71631//NITZ4_003689-RA/size126154-snap-gene-0.114-mRNA-1//1//CDS//3329553710//3070//frame0
MSGQNAKPVHPCVLNVWEGNAGAEYSTWANISGFNAQTPDLVTAQGSTLTIYKVEKTTGKLLIHRKYPNLAGSVCFLDTLRSPKGGDSLVVGFAGNPRLAVVTVTPELLEATSLVDLSMALQEVSYGATTPLEQDLTASLHQVSHKSATLAVALGGGVAVACLKLTWEHSGWTTAQPYILPLQTLKPTEDTSSPNNTSIITGFGDIYNSTFLPGYSEPTLVLLHSNPKTGQTWPGRLGRPEGSCKNGLMLTAIALTVEHERSAVLWSIEVPADAINVHATGTHGCVVQCVNSIVAVSNTGQLEQVLATNGWAMTTAPSTIAPTANPWPFPRLAIALDGADFAFVTDTTAFVVLRSGQVYLLQKTNAWSMLPLFHTVGGLGQVANVRAFPMGKANSARFGSKLLDKTGKLNNVATLDVGLLWVGSRLGDSTLLCFALEETTVAEAMKKEPGFLTKAKGDQNESGPMEHILSMEEEALYAPTTTDDTSKAPDVVPPSDDEETETENNRKRARLSQLIVVRSLAVLDAVTGLGPLGPGCLGPLSNGPTAVTTTSSGTAPTIGATGYVYPCGYGSSGGLAVVTVPGRDDRTIVAEEDCVNAKAMFNLPSRGLVLLSMSDKTRFLRLENGPTGQSLEEVNMSDWTSMELRALFASCELLAAADRNRDTFVLLVCVKVDDQAPSYAFLVVSDKTGSLEIEMNIPLPVPEGESIRSVAPIVKDNENVVLAYTLSTGEAKVITLSDSGGVQGFSFEPDVPMDMDDQELSAEEKFYAWGTITAVDVFRAPISMFRDAGVDSDQKDTNTPSASVKSDTDNFDEDDAELYGGNDSADDTNSEGVDGHRTLDTDTKVWLVGLVHQSGMLEVYELEELAPGQNAVPVWTSHGCGHGVSLLAQSAQGGQTHRKPRQYKVQTSELRFFSCGPSELIDGVSDGPTVFCLAVETSDGDVMLYKADTGTGAVPRALRRVPLKCPCRPSKEQAKHFLKLRRKGIVKQASEDVAGGFRHNRLFRFSKVSGQDGLFSATSQPLWLVAERGNPTILAHRCRHAAPAGSKDRPVSGFCSGVIGGSKNQSGCMTLHERVGRVGSQRLTVFNGILNLSTTHGMIPGGGFFIEKIPMGVTVRKIQYIDDVNVCGSRPLFAVLVSREIEEDMSHLNNDGLTEEERHQLAEEKESAKIKRQVEADLGGFDIEQEWVEEIEREDCFKVETSLGGAPPVQKSAYSLWIVDAANGWVVVDSFELDEFEYGLSMQVMSLSEFKAEPGTSAEIVDEDLESRMFIAVGTGIVDKDGEDVSSKGRVVLLKLTKPNSTAEVELNFVYEKKIFHGPVNSLSCLSSEGKNRMIIGAGADVNVEQWGNDKLTQVGFFRATMHILDIKLFKNFFVLSDAYDSIYFLVWRESDNSLTLLAKDYDPIPVYATGLLSRGGSLDMVCHDDRQNLQFLQYAPNDPAARGGNKLVTRADYHLGSQTIDMQSHFCRSSLLINSATPSSTIAALQQQDTFFGRTDDDQRLGVHFGTTDGDYGAILPLSEPVYWRLTALQSVIVNALESDCALSSRAWRLYRRSPRRGGCRSNDRKKGVIDGNVVMQFADLSLVDQEDLASAIGSTVDLIIDNLLELRCSAMIV